MPALLTMLVTCQLLLSSAALADPPPWAPAHGYYKDKHKPKHKQRADDGYLVGGYLVNGRCNREGLGQVLGGVVGGVAGADVGKGDTRTAAIIAGTIVGAVIGGSIGRSMDETDVTCVGQALEYGEENAPVTWVNPDTGTQYRVIPRHTYRESTGYCREFTREVIVGGRQEQVYGKACRQADGSWQVVH